MSCARWSTLRKTSRRSVRRRGSPPVEPGLLHAEPWLGTRCAEGQDAFRRRGSDRVRGGRTERGLRPVACLEHRVHIACTDLRRYEGWCDARRLDGARAVTGPCGHELLAMLSPAASLRSSGDGDAPRRLLQTNHSQTGTRNPFDSRVRHCACRPRASIEAQAGMERAKGAPRRARYARRLG